MKMELVMIEKNSEKFINDGFDFYMNKIKHYTKLEVIVLNPPKEIRKKSLIEQKRDEAMLLKKYFENGVFRLLLDEKGKKMTSVEFSKLLERCIVKSPKKIQFYIGGPYGVDENLKIDFDFILSFSDMTFSHQLIRLIFLEQLYRSFTIIKGEKYHHE
jgi:23S rRNA (pseudouridine1915-N3)-methyltransferase